jgi:hypothetical protein
MSTCFGGCDRKNSSRPSFLQNIPPNPLSPETRDRVDVSRAVGEDRTG